MPQDPTPDPTQTPDPWKLTHYDCDYGLVPQPCDVGLCYRADEVDAARAATALQHQQALERLTKEIGWRDHERALIEADTQRGITDCSTPLFQRVRNIVEALEAAEAELSALRAQLAEQDAEPPASAQYVEVLEADTYVQIYSTEKGLQSFVAIDKAQIPALIQRLTALTPSARQEPTPQEPTR
jgi:hypothetical protein